MYGVWQTIPIKFKKEEYKFHIELKHQMNIRELEVPGAYLIECQRFNDERGHFQELYRDERYPMFAQCKQISFSSSAANVVRGIHCSPYAKLISCVKGKVVYVCVDLRLDSPTFKKWISVELYDNRQIYVPANCGSSFFAVEHENIVVYGQEGTFVPGRDMEVNWRDPTLNIAWPHADNYIVSSKDNSAPYLDEAIRQWKERNTQ